MSIDPIEDLLRSADDSARKVELPAPRLTDLEQRRRHQLLRRASALLLLASLVPLATWYATVREQHREQLAIAATASLESSLGELETMLASLREARTPVESVTSEDVALETFRALHGSASRGDSQSLSGMRWLAKRFPATHGGRCAQLFLDEDVARATNSSQTEEAGLPTNERPERQ